VIFLYIHIMYFDQIDSIILSPSPFKNFNRFYYPIFIHMYKVLYFDHITPSLPSPLPLTLLLVSTPNSLRPPPPSFTFLHQVRKLSYYTAILRKLWPGWWGVPQVLKEWARHSIAPYLGCSTGAWGGGAGVDGWGLASAQLVMGPQWRSQLGVSVK
jgi:hypothetical protein